MENEAELIRDQMRETRTSLSEKLEALQEQVLGTVEGTTRSVTETVESVKEAVEGTVATVTESVQDTVDSVKHTFDVREQMQKHPWLMVGGAVVAGYVGGRLLMGRTHTALPPPSDGFATPLASAAARASRPSEPSWLDRVAGPLLKQAEELALGVIAGVAADLVKTSAPEPLRDQLNEMVEQFASGLGAKPIHGLVPQQKPGDGHAGPQPSPGQTGVRPPGSHI